MDSLNAIEYLVDEIDAKIEALREETKDKPLSLGKAYSQGKLDAYGFVLVTLKEALTAEEEG